MSHIKQTLILEVPTDVGSTKTFVQSAIEVCYRCFGSGNVGVYVDDNVDVSQLDTACPVCKGTGKVRAEIYINWESVK